MSNEPFDPIKELQEVKERREMQRRKLYRKSKLEKYRAELVAMRNAGASYQDLAIWLKMKHRITIHRTSVDRFLSGLPELAAIATPPNEVVVTAAKQDAPPPVHNTIQEALPLPQILPSDNQAS